MPCTYMSKGTVNSKRKTTVALLAIFKATDVCRKEKQKLKIGGERALLGTTNAQTH